ncbi:hypothetical protein NE237_029961 [Protea cynaroides]|uniref:Uncharacterized protein n=1 Tax=Protea cynaroides TaxID=273540 RepID=A0A9Q0GT60_9MAGN|nr:hypothetical protein NE237_029961 [Protea cynaroides]
MFSYRSRPIMEVTTSIETTRRFCCYLPLLRSPASHTLVGPTPNPLKLKSPSAKNPPLALSLTSPLCSFTVSEHPILFTRTRKLRVQTIFGNLLQFKIDVETA